MISPPTQRGSFDDLDARAPGIGNVCDRAAIGNLVSRLIARDTFRLVHIREGRVVHHVKTDVIEHASFHLKKGKKSLLDDSPALSDHRCE
jgi:hypothetical protein